MGCKPAGTRSCVKISLQCWLQAQGLLGLAVVKMAWLSNGCQRWWRVLVEGSSCHITTIASTTGWTQISALRRPSYQSETSHFSPRPIGSHDLSSYGVVGLPHQLQSTTAWSNKRFPDRWCRSTIGSWSPQVNETNPVLLQEYDSVLLMIIMYRLYLKGEVKSFHRWVRIMYVN